MSKMLISDLVKVLQGAGKVSSIAVTEQLREIERVARLSGIPCVVRSLCDGCFSLLKSVDPGKTAEYLCGRTYLLYKQTQIACEEVRRPRNQEFFAKSDFPNFTAPKRPFSSTPIPKDGRKTSKTLDSSRQRKVPSSRVGRIAGFGNLFVGLGLGAAMEFAKRSVGLSSDGEDIAIGTSNPFLTEANVERIVDTLCRMRGAALKFGQMLSIQDNALVSPKVQQLFERVRQSADFMPTRQMNSVINAELGPNWKDNVIDFEEKPFAAASIGQVHRATLFNGKQVAIKIQYPGVADSIDTDVANIMLVLKRFDVLPPGLFAEQAIKVAKREMYWECDYIREAAFAERFAQLFKDDKVFIVPRVIPQLSATRVYTTEYFKGTVLDDCVSLPQETRNWIGYHILRLCLAEVFTFNVMQTDPNWSNFLYCEDTNKIVLLDFGASREYSRKFVDDYLRVIKSAVEGDRDGVIMYSKRLGFLTGYETKVFMDAHVEAVNVLGEAFASVEPFDFGAQSTTNRISSIIPVMVRHRLTPPPTESYSLHRKMSGCFLLCGKLGAVIDCRSLYLDIINNYVFGLKLTPALTPSPPTPAAASH